MRIKIPDFANLFQDNVKIDTHLGEGMTKNIEVGKISLLSGQIVACDPFVSPGTEPFVNKVVPGEYPVVINIVHYLDDDDERIGAAMIKIKESKVVRWEMALKKGQDPNTLEDGEVFGYPVDSGTGCFMDYETALRYKKISQENPLFHEFILEETKNNYADTRDWADIQIEPSGNIITFSSGLGDGYYASYWGYDDENHICCLVTDFGLYEED
ncbi:DUF4241 domain-containing protein [Polycladomyces sp. WAk]|uniref:DUF4241 domain-containing protein n=1 Tax=Polycladomyces zharkentensis TaxID=2807616 RepID=A0ABS2WNM7_9BACL|nr:DUF4241 domain-containing protein [Polycladomyces sp. WAk]MBN2910860.1 DUF4241 domain-containing protein [Polycladomyces sp. WAk]